jgi:hypothetical protein
MHSDFLNGWYVNATRSVFWDVFSNIAKKSDNYFFLQFFASLLAPLKDRAVLQVSSNPPRVLRINLENCHRTSAPPRCATRPGSAAF